MAAAMEEPQPPAIRIFVDADACPVKPEIYRVAERYALKVYVVANAFMAVPRSDLIERVIVAEGPDAADHWIAERAGATDIVVTADIPLAGRCVRKGAAVIGSTSKAFTEDSIGMVLATRDLNRIAVESPNISIPSVASSGPSRRQLGPITSSPYPSVV